MSQRLNNILFIIAIVVIFVVTGWAVYKYSNKMGFEYKETAKEVKTQDFIQEKNLSDHPAMFYEEVGE